jgi:hypothetical protein
MAEEPGKMKTYTQLISMYKNLEKMIFPST